MDLSNEELPALIEPGEDFAINSDSNESFNSEITEKATSKSEIQIDNEELKSLVQSQIGNILE